MSYAKEFEMVGKKGTPERHAKAVCAVWSDDRLGEVFIGAPTLEQLKAAWKVITNDAQLVAVQQIRIHPDGNNWQSYVDIED